MQVIHPERPPDRFPVKFDENDQAVRSFSALSTLLADISLNSYSDFQARAEETLAVPRELSSQSWMELSGSLRSESSVAWTSPQSCMDMRS